jgi:HEPN domain-containing protein
MFELNKFYKHQTMVDVFFEVVAVAEFNDHQWLSVRWWNKSQSTPPKPWCIDIAEQYLEITNEKAKEYVEVVFGYANN